MNSYFTKLKRFVSDPEIRFGYLSKMGFYNYLDDEAYIKKRFRLKFGYEPDLTHPQTFNEKIQWLKLHDRKPVYTTMVDKYAVKEYAAGIIGSQYIIPTLGVWDRFEDIDFNLLPRQFVLKCTHDSGGLVIVRDKDRLDKKAAGKKIKSCLKTNYYYHGREWPYKDVKPRIIAEKYLEEKGHIVPEDYKIYCMNGEPKYIVVFHNRFDSSRPLSETVYDTDWNPQHISLDNHFAVSEELSPKPGCLDELMKICKKLCKDMAQVRLDFYIIENRIYFGEVTIHTASGFQPMIPEELDRILGEKLHLSKTGGGGYCLNKDWQIMLGESGKITGEKENKCTKDGQLKDYKIFNFDGEPRLIQVDFDRFTEHKRNLYSTDWEYIKAQIQYPSRPEKEISRPDRLEEMLALAGQLSKGYPYLRTDFYCNEDGIYFGELTFYPESGFGAFYPQEFGKEMGQWLRMPQDASE